MNVDSLGWKWICLGVALVCFSGALAQAPAAAQEEKPYRFVDGKVDFATYNGFRRFHNSCHVCHGPDALGTSFGPSLVESLTRISEDDFMEVVVNGRTSNVGGNQRVMPPFGLDPNVMLYIDGIYAYVKARSDGALRRGRPAHLPKPKDE